MTNLKSDSSDKPKGRPPYVDRCRATNINAKGIRAYLSGLEYRSFELTRLKHHYGESAFARILIRLGLEKLEEIEKEKFKK